VHFNTLNKAFNEAKLSPYQAFIITDASIKNDMVMAITHTWVSGSIIHKSKHQVHKITSPEAELFAIRCFVVGIPDCQSVTDSLAKYDIIQLFVSS